MMRCFVGIDPGLKGAVAVIDHVGRVVELVDTPTVRIDKKHRYNLQGMVNILRSYAESFAALELVHSMPRQGVASSFSFGRGLGIWEGLLAGMQIPFDYVTPQAWTKVLLAGLPKGKGASLMRARELFPAVADQYLSRESDDGRADSLLIAEYRRRMG